MLPTGFLLAFLGAASMAQDTAPVSTNPPPGSMEECGLVEAVVPQYTLEDVCPGSPTYGQDVSRPEFPGDVLLLYFALPTCGHCQAQVQQLQALWDAHAEQWAGDVTLQIIALSAGQSGLETLTDGISLPVLQDTEQAAVADQYGAQKWYVYVVDRTGQVRWIHYRFDLTNHADRLVAEVDALRAEEPQ